MDKLKGENSKESKDLLNGDLNINLDIDLNDSLYELNLKNTSKVKFHDSYSVPNATLASRIDCEDNFDVNAIYKSSEYYNQIFNRNRANNRVGINHRPIKYNSYHQHDSMMDYISKSQPLHGGSNLLAQFSKFHPEQNQSNARINKNKGKEPESNSELENLNQTNSLWNTAQPIPLENFTSSSPLKPPQSWSSVASYTSDEKAFDPNLFAIPSYKNKKHRRSHSNHHQFHQEMKFSKLTNDTTKTQEPIDIEDEHLTDNENEPLMMKSYTSSHQSSNAIDINTKPMKKSSRTKHRSSRPPPPSPLSSYLSSYSSSKFSGTFGSPINSSILAKTSQYIPDASLPYLVKSIDSHFVKNENPQNEDNEYNIYNLKGGDYARDIYNFNKKIKRSILSKRSKSEPNLYELNKKKENDFNYSEISVPGGFRREFMSSNAKKQGKTPPHWITSNFIDFLALYVHYAGDDDFDEDYISDDYGYDSWYDDDDNSSVVTDNEMNENSHFQNFNNEKMKILETRSSYEVLPDQEDIPLIHSKSKISIEIEPTNENTPLLSSSHSSLTKGKSKRQHKNNSSSQTGTASEGKTLFLLLKAFIGTGILFLPKAFSNGGLIFSLILLALSGWLTYLTMILLIRCSEKFGGSYGDIGKQLYGKPFKIMIQGSIALTQSGFCCAYIIFILQSIKSIVETVSNGSIAIPDWAIITAQILIYIPLSWIRKIQNFSITSLIADVFILIGLVYIICSDLFIISKEGSSNNFSYFNSEKFPLFLGTAIFAFEGIGLIIPLQRSMKEPKKFPKVLKKSMFIVFIAMFIVGSLSYYNFGDEVHTIIFMDVYPNSIIGTIVRALYTLAIIFSFPLTCYSGIHIVEPLFIPRQRPFKSFHLKPKKNMSMNYATIIPNSINSSDVFNSSKTIYKPDSSHNLINNDENYLASTSLPKEKGDKKNSSTTLTPSSSYSSLSNHNYNRKHRKRDTGKNSKVIKWMKNLFRAVFVSSLGVISYYGSSNLDIFVSLIGSCACIPLMFIYPALLHYRGVAETPKERLTDITIIIVGVIATAWITKLSLDDWK